LISSGVIIVLISQLSGLYFPRSSNAINVPMSFTITDPYLSWMTW